jgi:hypothetical protein
MTEHAADGVLYRIPWEDGDVVLRDEPVWSRRSTDNSRSYDREIVITQDSSWRALGVAVERPREAPVSAVLIVASWCPHAQEGSLITREGVLYLPLGPQVAALSLPSLEPRWVRTMDDACVSGLMEIEGEDALLVHGEMAITRLAMDGAIQWERGGADIFTGGCWIERGTVVAVDWNGTEYRWRLSDGEPLGITPGAHPPTAV